MNLCKRQDSEWPIRFYLCGPMTGRPAYNYPAFHDAAYRWREAGHFVMNPAENFGGDASHEREKYLRRAFTQVLEADALLVLPGWEGSEGARVEVAMARALGLPIYDALACPELKPI